MDSADAAIVGTVGASMATRCARCQAEDVTLETFGVFRCPACGLVDADGRALDVVPSGPVEVASNPQETFAEPPPWTPSDVSARARAALTVAETPSPPTGFLVGILVMAIVTLVSAASTGAWIAALVQFAMLAALATGRPWARMLSIFGSALSIVAVVIVLGWLRAYLPPSATPTLVVSLVADGVWLYVLFRDDTVRYFARV